MADIVKTRSDSWSPKLTKDGNHLTREGPLQLSPLDPHRPRSSGDCRRFPVPPGAVATAATAGRCCPLLSPITRTSTLWHGQAPSRTDGHRHPALHPHQPRTRVMDIAGGNRKLVIPPQIEGYLYEAFSFFPGFILPSGAVQACLEVTSARVMGSFWQ